MSESQDTQLAGMLAEYAYLGNIRSQHMAAYTQTNFYFGIIIAILGAAIIYGAKPALLILPIIIFIQMSIVQWNQYHHFLTEEYLCRLEHKIRELLKTDDCFKYHNYYRHLFFSSTFLKMPDSINIIIKPTALLSTYLAVFNILLIVYSLLASKQYLSTKYGDLSYHIYLIGIIVMLTLLVYNFLMIPKNIRIILDDTLDHYLPETRKQMSKQ